MSNEAVDDEEDDDPIDEEQLDDYREMIEQLGSFPDKVTINSLSMVAEDHASSTANARAIYECISAPLVSRSVLSDRKLPLVYVIDSILKNVKGKFISIIEEDAKKWMPIVYDAISDTSRAKLKKVWNLWKDSGVFQEASWREMGKCFDSEGSVGGASQTAADTSSSAKLKLAGIILAKDGSLVLKPLLRKAMQQLLDDIQSDVQDELEKVSLERLALIDPDLLTKIKGMAEDSLWREGAGGNNLPVSQHEEPDLLSFLIEFRSSETIERSKAWQRLDLNHLKETHDLISTMQHFVRGGSSSESRYTQAEAIEMTVAVAAAGCTATILTNALHQVQRQDENSSTSPSTSIFLSDPLNRATVSSRGYLQVNKSEFTSKGVKKKNDTVIGILYEVGLPFVSSSDGRRFATQLELSNHLDALFKKGQLEKTMARTEERGWYTSDLVWTGEATKEELAKRINSEVVETSSPVAHEDEADPSTFTVPADESRDRCVICGINFKMFFDNDDGIYKYSNCREMEVLNDDVTKDSDELLVHVTCWRGLGSPPVLTMDQALQEAIQH